LPRGALHQFPAEGLQVLTGHLHSEAYLLTEVGFEGGQAQGLRSLLLTLFGTEGSRIQAG